MPEADQEPISHELRVIAGTGAFNDGRIDELLMQAADIIDAVANYRAVVKRWAGGGILDGVEQETAAEERMYRLLDEANADAAAIGEVCAVADDLTKTAKQMAHTWSDTKWPGNMIASPDEFWDSLEEGHRAAWLAAARVAED